MPHALSAANPGVQALILCGPGVSLNTFTSNPEEHPKALIPIANRPMVWYPLEFCYRMGVSSIFLVTPPSSRKALEAALSQNPHLTSLPLPRPTVLAPADLSQTSGTAEILRLPQVRDAIDGDFVVLPCDLVCSIPGNTFLEQWMIHQAGSNPDPSSLCPSSPAGLGAKPEASGKGGLGVWFPSKGEGSTKGEETDFIMTSPLDFSKIPPPEGSLTSDTHKLLYSTTKDTLKDIIEDNQEQFPIRATLVRKHGRVKMLSTYRDAHFYVFPRWVLDFVEANPTLDSISEDVVGWWAKCGWQDGLAQKLSLDTVLGPNGQDSPSGQDQALERLIDLSKLTSFSRSSTLSHMEDYAVDIKANGSKPLPLTVPPMLAYVQPAATTAPLIRRVDTAALLLFVSLQLAKLQSAEEAAAESATPSPFSHPNKVAHAAGVAPRCTVTRGDCLLAENVTVEEKCVIKETVIGANCRIKTGARLTRCVLMDGAVVGEKAQLSGCILGRRSQVGKDCVLKDCEVQDGNKVADETDSKGEKFMIFEGLEEGEDGMEMGDTEEETESDAI